MLWSPYPKGECMRCGFKKNLRELRKEWTGNRVCSDCYDRRPEDLRPPQIGPEGIPRPNASPETPPVFVTPGVDDPQPSDL